MAQEDLATACCCVGAWFGFAQTTRPLKCLLLSTSPGLIKVEMKQ
jgi:hypothetical protein